MPIPAAVSAALIAAGTTGAQMGVQAGMAKGNSRRALRQQKAYTDMQMNANMTMADYNQKLAFANAEQGYQHQVKGMNDAGLNPALMYGTSGGGGITSAPAQGVSGGSEHGETYIQPPNMMGMMNATQLALLQSQKANIDADTENKKADTADKTGNTIESKGRIAQLAANTNNLEAKTAIANIDKEIQEVNLKIAGDTAENVINNARVVMLKANEELDTLVRNNSIGNELRETVINQAKADLATTYLQQSLMRANKTLTQTQTDKINKEINLLVNDLKWADTNQEDRHNQIRATIKNIETNTLNNDLPESWKQTYDVLESLLGGASHGLRQPNNTTHTHFHDAPKK